MQNWVKDNQNSIKAFNAIKDSHLPKLINGRILNIELSNNEVLAMLDSYSGIDAIKKDDTGIQGIAWRAQFQNKKWNTFTIRSERDTGSVTECQKRIEAINKGYFYPAYTIQAYFDNTESLNLLSMAIIKTKNLYKLFNDNKHLFRTRKSNNVFYFIGWSDIPPDMIKIWQNDYEDNLFDSNLAS